MGHQTAVRFVLTLLLATSAFGQNPKVTSVVGSMDKVFPHLALGGGWEMTLVLMNLGNNPVSFDQAFYDQAGRPMAVTFKTMPGERVTTGSATSGTVFTGAIFSILITDSSPTVKIGWSALTYDSSTARLGGYAIYRLKIAGRLDVESIVPVSAYDDSRFLLPYDNTDGGVTTMALLNPSADVTNPVSAVALDDLGRVIAIDYFSLSPGQQVSFPIPERFPETRGRVGSILVDGSPGRLTGVGFRFNAGGSFMAIPILKWPGLF